MSRHLGWRLLAVIALPGAAVLGGGVTAASTTHPGHGGARRDHARRHRGGRPGRQGNKRKKRRR